MQSALIWHLISYVRIKYKIKARYVDKNDRYIVLDTPVDNNPVIQVNYYAPNIESDQLKVLDGLAHICDQLQISENTTFISDGDFNLFFDVDLDADGGSPKLKVKPLSKLLSVMSENDLCYIYILSQKPRSQMLHVA